MAKQMTFEVFKSGTEWRFRVKAKNGEVIAQSEGYKNKKDCESTVGVIQAQAAGSKIITL